MKSKNPIVKAKLLDQEKVDEYVAKEIFSKRKALGLTLATIAKVIGTTVGQLCKYENGETKIKAGKVQAIANALGLSAGDLYPANDKTKNLLFLVGQQMRRIQEDADISIVHAKAAKKTAKDVEQLLLRA